MLSETMEVDWKKHYRIIPSVFPPINFFEDLVDADLMEEAWWVESLTNERLRNETGNIQLVATEDRICGPGSSVVMAAFTHIGYPSRFSNGEYGVYYAAKCEETAIRETIYHREHFLGATAESPCEITMRLYVGQTQKPLHDLRHQKFSHLHHPYDYSTSQQFAKALRADKAWGIVYNSVRHAGSECIAALRPPAISAPKQSKHLSYLWNGKRITHVKQMQMALML